VELSDHRVFSTHGRDYFMDKAGNLLDQLAQVSRRAPHISADVGEDVSEEITAIGKTWIGKWCSRGHDWWLEGEFIFEEDFEVEFVYGLFHLLGNCFVGLVRDGGLVDLKLNRRENRLGGALFLTFHDLYHLH